MYLHIYKNVDKIYIYVYNNLCNLLMYREEVNNCSALGKRSGTEVRVKSPEKAVEIDESTSTDHDTPLRTMEEGTTPKQLKL